MQSSTPKNAHLLNLSNAINVTHSSLPTEKSRIPPKASNEVFEKLNLDTFKLDPCKITQTHNHKQCIYYHNNQDRKRPGSFYAEELCEFKKDNKLCPKGDLCTRSHNQVEQLYREEKFKKKFCLHYPKNLDKCEYGRYCSFAHHEREVLTELIHNYIYDYDFYIFHYKTVSCPFNLNHHVKSLCVYAHNWQDYRRKPNQYNYDPTPCPYWNPNDRILSYEKGCPNMFNCDKCHGWKEAEYHPLNYKTKKCPNEKNCRRSQDCPHYHNVEEQRAVAKMIQFQFFKFVPRNRIIENTYKINSPRSMEMSMSGEMENPSKPNSSLHSIETRMKDNLKLKEATPCSSQGKKEEFQIKKISLNINEIDTLPIIQEVDRGRGFSLKTRPNEVFINIEKKHKRYSEEDALQVKNLRKTKEEEKKDESHKDSIMGSSDEMIRSKIPIIKRKESQDKSALSVVLSGVGEYFEENDDFIINQILEET